MLMSPLAALEWLGCGRFLACCPGVPGVRNGRSLDNTSPPLEFIFAIVSAISLEDHRNANVQSMRSACKSELMRGCSSLDSRSRSTQSQPDGCSATMALPLASLKWEGSEEVRR
uniref:Uncharacterized protein n=1 Tax=Calcidiscus leptoporus TaxID=127549 RepID=A0A7S0J4N4_9EUKA